MRGLGRIPLDMDDVAARRAHPCAARSGAHDQRRAQRGAQRLAQPRHRLVESAADGQPVVGFLRHAEPFGQRDGLLPVARPCRASQHKVLQQVVVDQRKRVRRVEDDPVIAGVRVGACPLHEFVDAGGGVVHQRVAADVDDVAGGGLHAVEGGLVSLGLRTVCGDIGLAMVLIAQHQAEAGIRVEPVLADVRDLVVAEGLAHDAGPWPGADDAGVIGLDAHATDCLQHAVAAADGRRGVVGHRESAGLRHAVDIHHDVHPNVAERYHRMIGFARLFLALVCKIFTDATEHGILLDRPSDILSCTVSL